MRINDTKSTQGKKQKEEKRGQAVKTRRKE